MGIRTRNDVPLAPLTAAVLAAVVVVVMKKSKVSVAVKCHLQEFKVVTKYARNIVYPRRAGPASAPNLPRLGIQT